MITDVRNVRVLQSRTELVERLDQREVHDTAGTGDLRLPLVDNAFDGRDLFVSAPYRLHVQLQVGPFNAVMKQLRLIELSAEPGKLHCFKMSACTSGVAVAVKQIVTGYRSNAGCGRCPSNRAESRVPIDLHNAPHRSPAVGLDGVARLR